MTSVLEDVKYGLRLIRRAPGFTTAAVLALALGIGANTAIFSVVDAVMLAPLPYADIDRLVMVYEDASHVGFPRNNPAPANWVDVRKQNTVFTDVAATQGAAWSITGDGLPEQIFGNRATASLWTILSTQPILGRVFTETEDQKNEKVVVISHGLWKRRYGADPNIAGRKILLNNEPFLVLGVMPRAFAYPGRRTDAWTPAAMTPEALARRGSHYLTCVARLKPGVNLQQAQTEMTGIMKRLEQAYPGSNRNIGSRIVPLREVIVGDTKTILIALICAAGCVLLIACANIANLLLARGSERQREIALRAAIGAGRWRLIRQLLTESLLLAGAGAVIGLVLARLGMTTLESLVPRSMAATSLHLDPRMLLFTLAVSLITGVLFGAAPALAGARLDLQDALKQGGRGMAGARHHFLRNGLVVGQITLALALLTGAGLMIQTLYRLHQVDIGLRPDHMLTLDTFPPNTRYPEYEKRVAFFNAVLEKVRAIPGVTKAGYTSDLPLTARGNTNTYLLRGQTDADTLTQDALLRVVTTDFMETIGARLREGRFFNESDRAKSQLVVLINETMANRHWPGQSPLGKELQVTQRGAQYPWLVVAGVVKEIRERGIDMETKPAIYLPLYQSASAWPVPGQLALRTAVEPASIAEAVRQSVWSIDKDQPVSRVRTMDTIVEETVADRRQSMVLLGMFAFLALVLASIGIYGVLSYMVAQRSREIAVRMAMGARPGQVLQMIARRGLSLTAVGLLTGVIASLGATRLLQTLLFGVKGYDFTTIVGVSLVLALVALAACVIPARRASKIDPAGLLRGE